MLKNPYFTLFSRSKATVCLEKPHCGALGVPFMNSMTGAALTKVANRLCNSSFVSFFSDVASGAVEDAWVAGVLWLWLLLDPPFIDAAVKPLLDRAAGGAFACFSIAFLTFAASLPETVSSTWLFLVKTKNGTAVTSNASLTSITSSASICTHDVASGDVTGYEVARVSRTVVICLHGAAHCAVKEMIWRVVGGREAT